MASPHQNTPYAPPSPHSTPTPTPQTHYPPPPPPPPPFSPFFTLISNPHTTSHKHPIVHYIFSDDDIDPLDPPPPSDHNHNNDRDRDRVIVVDVTDSAVTAQSLSRDWQVLGVKVAAAPQWAGETGGGLMLTVEGTEAPPLALAGKKGGSMEELEALYKERSLG
ncbi:hypothetical protein P167DRAFT_606521 [Morchella conica CCBAS932]|uniref:Uncharacterized protein n=1 Tax=Morchella conica CCBAS932 TaxID=1392247 RepID=A0A3N4KLI6_9PEZI|nr:hypothetical protein P167DRAFT_606521 [Morchella conica CCBAS932]